VVDGCFLKASFLNLYQICNIAIGIQEYRGMPLLLTIYPTNTTISVNTTCNILIVGISEMNEETFEKLHAERLSPKLGEDVFYE
jgi:hypothetical protein